jgi:hypothetical protein
MSNIRQRLARLERSAPPPANVCAGCAHLSPITLHEEYTLTSGETILLPPLPDGPPCTCGRRSKEGGRIRAMIFSSQRPTVMATREEAERDYAEHVHYVPRGEINAQKVARQTRT